jgi:hypothetical protein
VGSGCLASTPRKLSQGLLEDLRRLAALDEVPVVDDHRRHRVYPQTRVVLLALADLAGKLIGAENLPGALLVETHAAGHIH